MDVPRFIPVDSRVIHLVDNDDQPIDSRSLDQHGVFTRLTTFLESSFKLSFSCRDDEDRCICLSRTRNHLRYVVLVTWCVEDSVSSSVGFKVGSTDFNSFTLRTRTVETHQLLLNSGWVQCRAHLLTFLTSRIQRPREVPTFSTSFLRFLFVLLESTLVDHSAQVQNVSSHRGFTRIDVTDEDYVHMRFDIFTCAPSQQIISYRYLTVRSQEST